MNILNLEKDFVGRLEIEVLPWGMWTRDRARYQSRELADFIRPADARLRAITGVEMTDAYDRLLEDTNIFLDSEPGCRAINTVKYMNPALSLTFASELARARYVWWFDNTILPTFLSIAEKLSFDRELFRQTYDSDDMKDITRATFIQAGKYAHSYPSMFLESRESQRIPLSLMNYNYEWQKQSIEEYL